MEIKESAAAQLMALVTGASSGIGSAIAIALAANNRSVCLAGRDEERLEGVAAQVRARGALALPFRGDLEDDATIDDLVRCLETASAGLDVLVHCAGTYASGSVEETPVATLDTLYRLNVRAPYALTRALLPALARRRGQIVFINSSQGLQARERSAAYASTKHALRAIADSLRQEVGALGVRVLSVYPGRTATPTMARLYERQNIAYRPELLLQPESVAEVVLTALHMPRSAEVTHIELRPQIKSY